MFTRHSFLLALSLAFSLTAFGQVTNNIQTPTSINSDGATPDASAILDVQATNKGVLVPRMSTSERLAITGPAEGLLVFDTNTNGFWFFNGTAWQAIGDVQAGSPALLTDADGDTRIEVERTADADSIHFTVGGNEVGVMDGRTFHFTSPGASLFIGRQAGLSDDGSDHRNVFIGQEAGLSNTTGSLNTFVGTGAGLGNTEGVFNVFLGEATGYDNATGSNNTFLGQSAGRFNTDGNFNTFLGQAAGHANSTGGNNTFLGFSAGSQNVAGTGNVFVGNQAGMDETGSDRLYIDNGPGTEPLVYGEFDNDLLRVNGNLEVTGDLKLEDSGSPAPAAGTIRWNDDIQDFEGYTGTQWKSLTRQGDIWGNTTYSSTEDGQLVAFDGAADDAFGRSVSISGDFAIVGADGHDTGGNPDQGQAYVFLRSGSTWTEQAVLAASDGTAYDNFGHSVAISGDHAIVGAYRHDTGGNSSQGQAYIFHRSGSTWTEQAVLAASDGDAGDRFGRSVAISGDHAVVGAINAGSAAEGQAYVFHRSGSTWTEQAILAASDGAAGDHFGYSVAISGDFAIVGADDHDTGGNPDQGQAYVFHRSGSTWTEQAILAASDGAAGDWFGHSVSISGDHAVVGAIGHDTGGQAYVFHRSGSTWAEQATLATFGGGDPGAFGHSASISGDHVIVGDLYHENPGSNAQGRAFIFYRSGTTWAEQAILAASDGDEDYFGYSVSISGDHVIAGAPRHATGGNTWQGQAYFFSK